MQSAERDLGMLHMLCGEYSTGVQYREGRVASSVEKVD
jgi:hypothetical protein